MPAPKIPSGERYESFGAFMEAIQATHAVLQDPKPVRRVVRELVDDSAADGATWVEPSVWPGVFGQHSAARPAIETILEAGRARAEELGIGFGLMLAANRHESPAAAIEVARLARELRGDGVVSFGLDGDETVAPPEGFVDAFRIAREAALLLTPHAGELLGPRSVAVAVDHLGANRILHGIRAVEDDLLVERLAAADVCLDVCPTSNYRLSVVPNLHEHPLLQLLEAGVRCSLNADDPLLFNSSLLGEYHLARSRFGLSDNTLAMMARDSITFSGAPTKLQNDAKLAIDQWIQATDL